MRPHCLRLLFCILCIKKKKMQKATLGMLWMISSINRKAVQHNDFPKVCCFNNIEVDFLTQVKCRLTGEVSGESGFNMHWQSGGAFRTAAQVSHCHSRSHTRAQRYTHTHTYSFLVSDSRHPAMTWGVSLAASKAALNRQKYLLWQTDRPSPTTTCMQLSPILPLPFANPLVSFTFQFRWALPRENQLAYT